jgi:putative intracellular protease/amidase
MPIVTALFHNGVADWEPGVVLPLLHATFGFDVRVATPDGRGVESIGGVRVEGDTSFDTVDYAGTDLLLVIGSDSWAKDADAALEAKLRARVASGRPLAAICGGTLPLARAGLLDGRAHTSNALDFLKTHAPAYRGEDDYQDVPHAVTEGSVVTAPGTAPLSFACAAAALVLPERRAEIEGFWNMVRRESEVLGGDLGRALG